MADCELCEDTGWACESCGTRWEKKDGSTCCGAGTNCVCNPDGVVDWQAVHASISMDGVKTLVN